MSTKPWPLGVHGAPPTSKSFPTVAGWISIQRLPTDPIFYANLTLQNMANGSDYWIAQASDLSNVLATGTQSGTGDITISSVPAYSNPMLMEIRVRLPGYQPLKTFASLISTGSIIYIAQVVDTNYRL